MKREWFFPTVLGFLLVSCAGSSPQTEGESSQNYAGGKNYTIELQARSTSETHMSFWLLPPNTQEWDTIEQECVAQLEKALLRAGYTKSGDERSAALKIEVNFATPEPVKGLSLYTLLGGYKHSVDLKAMTTSGKILWTLKASTPSEFEDRRTVFPYMSLAMLDYFGKTISTQKDVTVNDEDPRLKTIKN